METSDYLIFIFFSTVVSALVGAFVILLIHGTVMVFFWELMQIEWQIVRATAFFMGCIGFLVSALISTLN